MYLYFFAFCWFRLLDYPSLLNRNTKYLITCRISQHSNNIWLRFCNDIHLKCESYFFKYSCKKCSHNRKPLMVDIYCYSQPTSKCIWYLKERNINRSFIYFPHIFTKSYDVMSDYIDNMHNVLVNPAFL